MDNVDNLDKPNYVYVLKLGDDREEFTGEYYVGKSNRPDVRLMEHMTTHGARATREYPPIERISLEKFKCPDNEFRTFMEYFIRFGYQNVWGDDFCTHASKQRRWRRVEKALRVHICYRCHSLDHLTPDCRVVVSRGEDNPTRCCYWCFNLGHDTLWCCEEMVHNPRRIKKSRGRNAKPLSLKSMRSIIGSRAAVFDPNRKNGEIPRDICDGIIEKAAGVSAGNMLL